METLSFQLTTKISCPKQIIAWGRSQIFLPFFFLYALAKALFLKKRFDIIHLSDLVLSAIGYFIKMIDPHKTVVVNVHGLDVLYPNPVYQWYLKKFGHACDLYICNSRSTEKVAKEAGIHPTVAIPIGINLEEWSGRYERKELNAFVGEETSSKIVLITLGRLVRRKGVGWLAEHVLPHLPKNFLYLVVGDGKEKPYIEEILKNTGLTSHVRILGGIPGASLKMLLHTSDLFVMPNVPVQGDKEGFGIVALEAAACGLPILASRLEGIKDAVVDKKTGELLTPGDAQAYITKLSHYMEHPEELSKLKGRGLSIMEERFSWTSITQEYLKAFTTVRSQNGLKNE